MKEKGKRGIGSTVSELGIKNATAFWNLSPEELTEIAIAKGQAKITSSGAVNINTGDLIWQTSTQPNTIYQDAYSYKASDLVISKNSIIFSNNKNEFFLLDKGTGTIQWKQSVNSYVRPTIIDNLIFTVSLEGYLVIIDNKSEYKFFILINFKSIFENILNLFMKIFLYK